MKFVVEIPDELFWKIAAKAEVFDQRVDEYTLDLLIAASHAPTPVETDPVFRLWRGGYTDKQIGQQLNLSNSQVQFRRRKYGLPANRREVREGSPGLAADEVRRREAHMKSGAFRLDEQQRRSVARKEAA